MKGTRRFTIALLVAVLVALCVFAPGAVAKNKNPRVIPPHALAFGMSYGDWGAKWWQWALASPKADNALNDPTGEKAGVGQSGEVWFLAGTVDMSPTPENPSFYLGVADRTCTVPAGKAVFFPIINVEASTAEGNGETEAELAALCDWYVQHTTSMLVTIDGRELKDPWAYRGTSSMYPLWWPSEDPVFALPVITEPTNSVSDGYWVMLPPLRVGQHELHWEGVQTFTMDPDGFDSSFAQDITYHLTVK